MLASSFALFGLIVGSFLNVIIVRFGKTSAVRGRSACPSCKHTLYWYDLVPVLSFLFLRGKCRYCATRISWQYPLVEVATGALFGLVGGAALPAAPAVLFLAIVSVLVCIFVYDLRHKLIPNAWAWTFIALSFLFGALASAPPYAQGAFIFEGPIAALPILFLWYLSAPVTGSPGQWMGFGDVKLALGIGWLLPWQTSLGIPLGVVAVFVAFIIGAFVSVFFLLPLPHLLRLWGLRAHDALQGYTMKSEVPFGPFLIVSCLIIAFAVMYHAQFLQYL